MRRPRSWRSGDRRGNLRIAEGAGVDARRDAAARADRPPAQSGRRRVGAFGGPDQQSRREALAARARAAEESRHHHPGRQEGAGSGTGSGSGRTPDPDVKRDQRRDSIGGVRRWSTPAEVLEVDSFIHGNGYGGGDGGGVVVASRGRRARRLYSTRGRCRPSRRLSRRRGQRVGGGGRPGRRPPPGERSKPGGPAASLRVGFEGEPGQQRRRARAGEAVEEEAREGAR